MSAHTLSNTLYNEQVGMGNPNITIDLGMVMVKELVFKGSFRYGVCPSFFG